MTVHLISADQPFERFSDGSKGGCAPHAPRYFQEVDGVALGSPVGPLLANIFVSRFDAGL